MAKSGQSTADWRTDAQNIPAYQVTEVEEHRAMTCPGDDVEVQTKLKLKLL